MPDKAYCIAVHFAHDVHHYLTVDEETKDMLERWADGEGATMLKVTVDGTTYRFNRDYLCSMSTSKYEPPKQDVVIRDSVEGIKYVPVFKSAGVELRS